MTREQVLMERINKVASSLSSDKKFLATLQDHQDTANAKISGIGGTNSSDKLLEQMKENPFFLSRCFDD
jgi:hypothetical protein